MLLFIPWSHHMFTPTRSFQNIVCYCLSEHVCREDFSECNFKTSYVTVYQIGSQSISLCIPNFKTSYVTVYRKIAIAGTTVLELFQNIVCYCLSMSGLCVILICSHFKTSYVTVYRYRTDREHTICSISKHRMLLFIDYPLAQREVYPGISKHRMLLFISMYCCTFFSSADFKTSYVTVYP